jgi:hypothetical protein
LFSRSSNGAAAPAKKAVQGGTSKVQRGGTAVVKKAQKGGTAVVGSVKKAVQPKKEPVKKVAAFSARDKGKLVGGSGTTSTGTVIKTAVKKVSRWW